MPLTTCAGDLDCADGPWHEVFHASSATDYSDPSSRNRWGDAAEMVLDGLLRSKPGGDPKVAS